MQENRTMSNIDKLQWWVDAVNIGVVISLALSFVFGGLSIWLSRKQGIMKDEQAAAEKLVSDQNIAKANADAAKANEGIGKSNEEIARLNAEAENAKSERTEADKQIAKAKADATSAAERTAVISLRVEEEARKRVEAEQALLELQEKLKPRSLTSRQRSELIGVLSKDRGHRVFISCKMLDSESCGFADILTSAFLEAGWNVFPNKTSLNDFLGLTVFATTPTETLSELETVRAAFKAAGITHRNDKVATNSIGQFPADAWVLIVVGRKPE